MHVHALFVTFILCVCFNTNEKDFGIILLFYFYFKMLQKRISKDQSKFEYQSQTYRQGIYIQFQRYKGNRCRISNLLYDNQRSQHYNNLTYRHVINKWDMANSGLQTLGESDVKSRPPYSGLPNDNCTQLCCYRNLKNK